MTEKTESQSFYYRRNDMLAGGKLIDEQVAEWYDTHANCQVIGLYDERSMEIVDDKCICVINVLMKWIERKDNE